MAFSKLPNPDHETDKLMAEIESNQAGAAPVPGWRRDFEGERERNQEPANPEIEQVLSGLLTPRPETYAEELRRKAREQGHELRDTVDRSDRDHDLGDDLDRW